MNEDNNLDCSPETASDGITPRLSKDALCGLLGKIVALALANSEAHAAALLFSMLSWLSVLVGPGPFIWVGDTKHYARIFCAIVGNSSKARKGTSSAPIERICRTALEMMNLPSPIITPGPLVTGEGLIMAVRDESVEVNPKTKLPLWQAVLDKRIIVLLEELGATLAAMARLGSTLSGVLRTAWDHGNLAPLTKFNQLKATGAHLVILAHITRIELSTLLCQSDIWNGLANRFLWVFVKRDKLVSRPTPMPEKEVDALAAELGAVLLKAQKTQEMTFSAEAAQFWDATYEDLSEDLPGVFGVVTSRSEAQVIRLSLLYAIADRSDVIDVPHLTAALAAWDYCKQSAKLLFGKAEPNPRATKLLQALEAGPMSRTEIHAHFGNNLKKLELADLLTDMETAGKITSHTGRGGMATTYALNRSGK